MTVAHPDERQTGVDPSGDRWSEAEVEAPGERRFTWRVFVFAPLMAGLLLAVPVLAWKGLSILRTGETGEVIGAETDPTAPGYQALVTPTPTAMIVDEDAQGGLAGVTLITLPTQEGGGNVMFLPVGTVLPVPLRQPPEASLVDIYAEGGVQALEQRVETLMGAGIQQVIKVPEGQWGRLVEPVGPLSFDNPIGVSYTTPEGQQVSFPEGPIALPADQVGSYLQARGPEEADTVRLTRHEAFWTAWLAALDEAGADAVPGEGQTGVGGFVRGLTGGPRSMMTLPATPIPVPGLSPAAWDLFRPNTLEIVAMVPDLIPFPQGVGRSRTRLVMGVEDQAALLPTVARSLVQAGAEITVIANDDEFDETQTVVYFFDEADRERAQRYVEVLGVGRVVKDASLSDTVDMVVVLGQDYVDAQTGGGATATTAPGGSIPTGGATTGGGLPTVTPGAPGGAPVG